MPDRMLRGSLLTSATLYRLTDGAERLCWRLVVVADDFGRFEAEPQIMKNRCFPLWPDARMAAKRVAKLYEELEAAEMVRTYSVGGKRYGYFVNWDKYQRRRAQYSKYPEPSLDSLISPPSADICQQVTADVARETRDESRETRVERRESRVETTCSASTDGNGWGKAENLIELYNAETPDETPSVVTFSPERIRKGKEYLAKFPERAFWLVVFRMFHKSRFLRGLTPPRPGHKTFRADYDWLLSRGQDGTENVVKVHDGRYLD